MKRGIIPLLLLLAAGPAWAEQVTVTGASVYVTKSDCMALVRHHPAADVTYQPGADVHGKYVTPADLPGGNSAFVPPDKVQFDLKINPMTYGQAAGQTATGQTATGQTTTGQSSATQSSATQSSAISSSTAQSTGTSGTSGKFANTELSIGHVSVDLKTGQALLDGRPLDGDQEQVAAEACRKAGYH
ncbi:hypothetical protein [Telmatospirillum sp.]|uniref:hypothetical protein n=1 Tax=Telmatospirillum sp. TaxID=2079197 RepID=UPI0028424BB1|nr:hypothetical protein [Telmatospirillum sp.]MDR3436674.1 hypothetical protein [Telmatospirillum sp.]